MKSFLNEQPLTYAQFMEIENEIYEEEHIDNTVEEKKFIAKDILNRPVSFFEDRTYNLPQSIFFIKYDNYIIFGRKIRSVLSFENKINAIHCSMITASMLLGILKSEKHESKKIEIEYYPFLKSEKLYIFNKIKRDRMVDIYYPYKYLDINTNKEECSPITGWTLTPEKVIYLGYGEEHIRKYTIKFLNNNNILKKGDIVYDPACSTGQFLNSIKQAFPFCKTIGQDLSKEMVEYAKDYVDEIYCGDSINSPLEKESVDLMFLRFLNSEVVTTKYAYELFDSLINKVKKNGIIIIFGHTPVLLKEEYFEKVGLKVIERNAYDEQHDCIFQYYVLRR